MDEVVVVVVMKENINQSINHVEKENVESKVVESWGRAERPLLFEGERFEGYHASARFEFHLSLGWWIA